MVENGANGWLIPAGSIADLVHAMGEALGASPEQLERMGYPGRQRVLERHDITVEMQKLKPLFQETVS